MRYKHVVYIITAVAVLCAAFLIGQRIAEKKDYERKAAELFAQENYTEARKWFVLAGDSKQAENCDYLAIEAEYCSAIRVMQHGGYLEAQDKFKRLGNYKDSANMLLACKYFYALELCSNGSPYEGIIHLQELQDYPGATREIDKAKELLYSQAVQLSYDFSLEEAIRDFRLLGDYKRSTLYAERCEKILSYSEKENSSPRICEENRFENAYYDKAYTCDLGYFTVPEKCDSDTRFFLYFPGGREDKISVDFFYYYLMNPAPNTVALFLYTNGLNSKHEKTDAAIDMLEQIAAELNLVVHDIVVCGSSLGAYTAMHSILYCLDDYGIDVSCMLSLDAGSDWAESASLLSNEQCERLAATDVQFYLYESPFVGMNRTAIWNMVMAGIKVTMVACTYDEHERISYDALGLGVVDWSLGDRKSEFRSDIYKYIPLSKTSTYPL